jgi:hypothetical protein
MVLRLGSSILACCCDYDYERCEDAMVAFTLMD